MKILSKEQEKAIQLLAGSELKNKFYWTGGTLLAYRYLSHRKSEDLDFFTDEQFSFDEVNRWVQEFKELVGFSKVGSRKIHDRWEFLFENKSPFRIEFVYYNKDKKVLGAKGEIFGVKIDSLEDIAANKLVSFFDRNEPKDIFDIYFLITKSNFTPIKLIGLAFKKFGVEFDEASFWSESFKGLKLLFQIKPLMLGSEKDKEKLLEKIQNYFREESNKFLKRRLA